MAQTKPSSGQRCFVLFGGVPKGTSEPLLKKQLRDQTTDVMRVAVLTDDNLRSLGLNEGPASTSYGLALYANERAALSAKKVGVTFSTEKGDIPLEVIPMQPAKSRALEDVYSEVIEIEGKMIPKTSLSATRGLHDVYRGKGIPRWCQKTLHEEDCDLGTQCRFVHLAEHQRTTRRRRDVELDRGEGPAPEPADILKDRLSSWIPGTLLQHETQFVNVTYDDAKVIISGFSGVSDTLKADLEDAIKRVKAASGAAGVFVTFNLPHAAPWDAPFSTKDSRLGDLKKLHPLPAGGLCTPQRRDRYIASVWKTAQAQLRCADSISALQLLADSHRATTALRKQLDPRVAISGLSGGIKIVVSPFVDIPSPFHLVRIFYVDGEVYTALQREDYLVMANVTPGGEEESQRIMSRIDRAVRRADVMLTEHFEASATAASSGSSSPKRTFCVDAVVLEPADAETCVTVFGLHQFEEAAAGNALFPSEPPTGELSVRFRQRRSCETHHLPIEWLSMIPH